MGNVFSSGGSSGGLLGGLFGGGLFGFFLHPMQSILFFVGSIILAVIVYKIIVK